MEATIGVLKKRVSTKINYSALEGLFRVDQNIFGSRPSTSETVSEAQGMEETADYNSDVDEFDNEVD